MVERLAELPALVGEEWNGAQTAFQLLRQCASQQIGHLLRTTPPGAIQEEAAAFDEEMERAAEMVLGLDPLSPAERTQLQLPLRLGGFGLPSQRALADCAWLGSWLQCLAPVTRASAVLRGFGTSCTALNTSLRCAEAALSSAGVSLWEATTANGEGSWEEAEENPVLKGQRHLQHQAAKARREELLQGLERAGMARQRSYGGPGAAAWLQALPTAPALCLPDTHFRLASRMRLGQATLPPGRTCQRRNRAGQRCGTELTPEGAHCHTCYQGRQRPARHDGQRRATARILRRHRIGCEEEVRVPELDRPRRDGTMRRARLDNRVEGGPGAPVRLLDHSVVHPTAPSYVRAAAEADGAAARSGERTKYRRYGRRVLAMLTETYGRHGPDAVHWWRQLAKQVAEADPLLQGRGKWAVAGLLAQWWAETSVALQRANAEAVLASLGALEGPAPREEDDDDALGDLPVAAVLLPAGEEA